MDPTILILEWNTERDREPRKIRLSLCNAFIMRTSGRLTLVANLAVHLSRMAGVTWHKLTAHLLRHLSIQQDGLRHATVVSFGQQFRLCGLLKYFHWKSTRTAVPLSLHQTFTFHPSTRTKQIWFVIALNYSKHFLPFCIWPVLLKTEYVKNRLAGKWQSNYFWYSLCRFADAAIKQRRQSRILRR